MTTIMVATIIICVNTTVIMTMTMIMLCSKTMIMTMIATKTITKFFKIVSTRQFLLLAQNDKKDTKLQFALFL